MRFTLCCALALVAAVAQASTCVVYSNGKYSISGGPPCATAAAVGIYDRSSATIGWDRLQVQTGAAYPDHVQAHAAGYFEGYQSMEAIEAWYANIPGPQGSQPANDEIRNFLQSNANWIAEQVAQHNATDPYWRQVGLMWAQFEGMLEGLQARGSRFGTVELLLLTAQGDMLDLEGKYPNAPKYRRKSMAADRSDRSGREAWRNMTKPEFWAWLGRRTHCSALIKHVPTTGEVFFGHATWQNYNSMLRILKTFTFNFNNAAPRTLKFSSWPGALSSEDDFYVMDSGLSVIETSLSVFNDALYAQVTPQSLPSWIRVMVANHMARGGRQWADLFRRHNSGTYNNQWMVLDRSLIRRDAPLAPNTLWIVEQLPGLVEAQDRTSVLQYGYWPSYNVPAFRNVFELAGFPEAIKQQGPEMLSYQTCVRAQLFRNNQGTVVDLASFKQMLQYNQYQSDPIQQGNPIFAIAARGDLVPASLGGPQLFGAVDCKVSSVSMTADPKNFRIEAFAGPTPQQRPFAWADFPALAARNPHAGLPAMWNFTWTSL